MRFNPKEVAEAARRLRGVQKPRDMTQQQFNDSDLCIAYALACCEGPTSYQMVINTTQPDGRQSQEVLQLIRRDPEMP